MFLHRIPTELSEKSNALIFLYDGQLLVYSVSYWLICKTVIDKSLYASNIVFVFIIENTIISLKGLAAIFLFFAQHLNFNFGLAFAQ